MVHPTTAVLYVGIDAHQDFLSLAVLPWDREHPERARKIPNEPPQIRRAFARLQERGEVRAVLRAGGAEEPAPAVEPPAACETSVMYPFSKSTILTHDSNARTRPHTALSRLSRLGTISRAVGFLQRRRLMERRPRSTTDYSGCRGMSAVDIHSYVMRTIRQFVLQVQLAVLRHKLR